MICRDLIELCRDLIELCQLCRDLIEFCRDLTELHRDVISTNHSSHWPLWGEFTGDRWILRKMASNAENVSIWWRHHALLLIQLRIYYTGISWKT